MKSTTKLWEGSYVAPDVDVCTVEVESGFVVSSNPNFIYGSEGSAGALENGNSYEL